MSHVQLATLRSAEVVRRLINMVMLSSILKGDTQVLVPELVGGGDGTTPSASHISQATRSRLPLVFPKEGRHETLLRHLYIWEKICLISMTTNSYVLVSADCTNHFVA